MAGGDVLKEAPFVCSLSIVTPITSSETENPFLPSLPNIQKISSSIYYKRNTQLHVIFIRMNLFVDQKAFLRFYYFIVVCQVLPGDYVHVLHCEI